MTTDKPARAVLDDGRTIDYLTPSIGEGATKEVFLSANRSDVVCLYTDVDRGQDAERRSRLRSIITNFNPTVPRGSLPSVAEQAAAAFFSGLFRWPTAVVASPRLGFVAPAITSDFLFRTGPEFLRGRPMSMTRFLMPRTRQMLGAQDPKLLGDLKNDLASCQLLTRAVKKLNQAGLAHSDLSPSNVLVEPATGKVCLIDLDGLVVPGRYPATVLGTRRYIAPDVVSRLETGQMIVPTGLDAVGADQHALAVLLYQYLFHRHPLDGRRIPDADTAEEQDDLAYGRQALYCEHPDDDRNRPEGDDYVPCDALGPDLAGLFRRAFVAGLRDPEARPTALEWLDALIKASDMLRACDNPACPRRWFVLIGSDRRACPFCGTVAAGPTPTVALLREVRGCRRVDRRLVISKGLTLHRWHVDAGVFQGPSVDATPLARFAPYGAQWRLINMELDTLARSNGQRVRLGGSMILKDGMELSLSDEPHARRVRVEFWNRI